MLNSNVLDYSPDLFQGKSQSVKDLYRLLLDELNKIGPIHEIKKAMFVSLENRKAFALAMIRNRSIKLVLRTDHRIFSPRIHSTQYVADKIYDNTVMLESKSDVDGELLQWLGDAYQASK